MSSRVLKYRARRRARDNAAGRRRRSARHHQDRSDAAAHRRVRRVRQLRHAGRQDRRGGDQQGRRRARQEDRADRRGQQVQSDRSRRHRREADRQGQGAGDAGRLELDADAGRHAQARGIQGADAGRDILLRQDHHVRQPLHLPHQPDLGDGGRGLHAAGQDARHQEGGLPRHQQRLRSRRLQGILRDGEEGRRHGRRHGDDGPEGHRLLGAARQDQGVRLRHAVRHHGGRADHAHPEAGQGPAAHRAHHHHGRLQLARPADRAGR